MADNINSVLYEAALKQAVTENCMRELRALPNESQLAKEYKFSDGFLYKMNRLINLRKQHIWVHKAVKTCAKAVAVLMITFAILFGALIAVSPEVRAVTVDFVTEWFRDHTAFYFQRNAETQDGLTWRPEYIPKDYQEQEVCGTEHIVKVVYINESRNELEFIYMPRTGSFSIGADNENKTQSIIRISGGNATLLTANSPDERSTLVWNNEELGFMVSGAIDTKELIKMARSVKKE